MHEILIRFVEFRSFYDESGLTMEGQSLSHDNTPAALLRWYLDTGVDEVTGTEPVNRFELNQPELNPREPNHHKQGHLSQSSMPAQSAPTSSVRLSSPNQSQAEASQIARTCTTLAELEAAIRAFNGCALRQTAMNTVFCDGDPASGLMFVGEAPGAEEDRQGKPFVGASGQLLDRILAAIGRDRATGAYISNILPWRPPGNRKPTPQETAICLPFIRRHIELVTPRILVYLGGTSAGALMETTQGITRLRGKWTIYQWGDRNGQSAPALPTYHPAYLLRQPQLKSDVWRDFLEIRTRLETCPAKNKGG